MTNVGASASLEELDQHVARHFSFRIEPRGLGRSNALGRQAELINKDVDECNLVVTSLFMRWGTPRAGASEDERIEKGSATRATQRAAGCALLRDILRTGSWIRATSSRRCSRSGAVSSRERVLLHEAYRHPAHWAITVGNFLSEWLFEPEAHGGPGPGDRVSLSEVSVATEGSGYVLVNDRSPAEGRERLRAQVGNVGNEASRKPAVGARWLGRCARSRVARPRLKRLSSMLSTCMNCRRGRDDLGCLLHSASQAAGRCVSV